MSYHLKLDHWIIQFKSFHWLSHHGLWAIIHVLYKYGECHCTCNLLGHLFYFSCLLYFGGSFNNTIIVLLFNLHSLDVRHYTSCWLSNISYPMSACGIIIANYTMFHKYGKRTSNYLREYLYLLYFTCSFPYLGASIIPLKLVGYEIIIANSVLHASLAIYHLYSMHTQGIIVKYTSVTIYQSAFTTFQYLHADN